MPYLAKLEKAGIPTVLIDLADQNEMVKQDALRFGIPHVRNVHASRTLAGPEDVDQFVKPMLDALTRPLTEEEKKGGTWTVPQDRIVFNGTLDEAETFYGQTMYVPRPVDAPMAVYTDGFPVRIPTEERVKEMLRGTSHPPDEIIRLQQDMPGIMGGRARGSSKKGDPVLFEPLMRTATVEKVATIAVMAGCKPEQLPVVLAIAQSGTPIVTTNFPSQAVCLSGPITKELKMNLGCGEFGPGSYANGPIGRSYQLMAINLSGAVPGVNRMGCHGSPLNNGGVCFGENADWLPPGWLGMNEEAGFKKNESVAMVMQIGGGMVGSQFSPGGYRALQKSGHGGIARRFNVKGTPGPHNWLDYILPGIWAGREGGTVFVMVKEMADHLYKLGFKTKDAVYEYIYKKSFEPLGVYRTRSWPDFRRNGWMGIEPTSGKPWKELPDDYMVPAGGDDPFENMIIVAGGEEEASVQLMGPRGNAFSIDYWR